MSRQECGALKSYVQELEDKLKEKDKEIEKLNRKNKDLQHLQCLNSANVQVDRLMSMLYKQRDNVIKSGDKKVVKFYKRLARNYNAWYKGCKMLITLMGEIRSPSSKSPL